MSKSAPEQASSLKTKKLGQCDNCGEDAMAVRHDYGIELYKGDDGEWHGKEKVYKVRMCPYHQGSYIHYMEERRKELAKKYGRQER